MASTKGNSFFVHDTSRRAQLTNHLRHVTLLSLKSQCRLPALRLLLSIPEFQISPRRLSIPALSQIITTQGRTTTHSLSLVIIAADISLLLSRVVFSYAY